LIKFIIHPLYLYLTVLLALNPVTLQAMDRPAEALSRPNILLIVADDLGYTDLGSFGSEIETPNLDKLANTGIKFTSLYAAPTCSPTRAMLLSGTDNHIAGLGNMAEEMAPNQKGKPGYEGYLNDRVVSVASLLKDAGYRTYMTGKWHLGLEEVQSPAARGFDRSFALLQGGAGHFDSLPIIGPQPALYRENGKPAELPKDFYSTRFYTDKLIEYIETDSKSDQPFFAYLAYTAPHWPLQAPESSIAKYRGKYDAGYDQVLAQRIKRMAALGLIPKGAKGWPRFPGEKAWQQLSAQERKVEARKMEIYAAMVDDMDSNVGRLLNYLEQIGERDNTFIYFVSDNGAEGHHLERGWSQLANWVAECCDNSFENMGKASSYIWYGPNWGRVSSGPFSFFKGFTTEGGIRVPGFIHYPGLQRAGEVSDSFTTVMDFLPTALALAGVEHPGSRYQDRAVATPQGASLLPYLDKRTASVHADDYVMGWELFGKRAVRQGGWKIVLQAKPYGSQHWQLYNLADDPSEQEDLAAREPEKLKAMIALWEQYARNNNIILPDHVNAHY